jgi:hypothetical protein
MAGALHHCCRCSRRSGNTPSMWQWGGGGGVRMLTQVSKGRTHLPLLPMTHPTRLVTTHTCVTPVCVRPAYISNLTNGPVPTKTSPASICRPQPLTAPVPLLFRPSAAHSQPPTTCCMGDGILGAPDVAGEAEAAAQDKPAAEDADKVLNICCWGGCCAAGGRDRRGVGKVQQSRAGEGWKHGGSKSSLRVGREG